MIHFNQYINEKTDDPIQLIEKNCKPFLKAVGDHTKIKIYRGVSKTTDPFWKRKVRKDRKPSLTSQLVHNALDDLFQKKFKVRLRSKCLFVTGKRTDAEGYGKVYSIYPIGNFKFYWHPKIEDISIDLPEKIFDFDVTTEDATKILIPIIKGYKDANLKKAIKSGNEIMIDCKEYYALED